MRCRSKRRASYPAKPCSDQDVHFLSARWAVPFGGVDPHPTFSRQLQVNDTIAGLAWRRQTLGSTALAAVEDQLDLATVGEHGSRAGGGRVAARNYGVPHAKRS